MAMSDTREQFLLDRKAGIGGSDVAAIMGISPFKTALDIYFDKTKEQSENINPAAQQLKRGTRAEEYVLKEYAEKTKEDIETGLSTFRDAEYAFLIGNIDAKVKDKPIYIEAKTYYGNIEDWGGNIPLYYLTQVAHYAYITDAEKIDVAVLGDRWKYACFTYQRNKEYEQQIKTASINFWHNNVLKRIPPQPQNVIGYNMLYPKHSDEFITATAEIEASVNELIKVQAYKKEIEQQEDSIKMLIMEYMKTANLLKTSIGYKATWKSQQQSRLNTQLIKERMPELYKEYSNVIEMRPFRLIKEKAEKRDGSTEINFKEEGY